MVHALRAARRVLKPDGLILDLRPGLQHRRVSVVRAGRVEPIAAMREQFDDVRAANRAVKQLVAEGRLRLVGRQRVACDRVMDGLDDLRAWLAEFASRDDHLPPHDWLVARVGRVLGAAQRRRASVVVAGPLELRVLRKPAKP